MTLEQLRQQAQRAFEAGSFLEAIQTQLQVINLQQGKPESADDFLYAALYLYTLPDFLAAAQLLQHGLQLFPADGRLWENLGVCHSRTGQYADALRALSRAESLQGVTANLLDTMAHCHGALGESAALRQVGERVLQFKDAALPPQAAVNWPAAAFDPDGVNIISFSLFGDSERYLLGAQENVLAAQHLYPGWRCRFYCDDSVPLDCRKNLHQAGAEVVMKPRAQRFVDGLFWRFEVMSDPSVSRFLVRDADSVVTVRERLAVNEWLASGQHFHVMRDWYTHTDLILAGMWGGIGGLLPPYALLQQQFRQQLATTRNLDQQFLAQIIWPRIRHSVLIHDRWFPNFQARPFPPGSELGGNRHVGQNAAVLRGKVPPLPEGQE